MKLTMIVALAALVFGGCAGTLTGSPNSPPQAADRANGVRKTVDRGDILYAFAGGKDGAGPRAALLAIGTDFYGTTYSGGGSRPACRFEGCGTVFALKQSGARYQETVLHRLDRPDGEGPNSAVTVLNGSFFGVAVAGGNFGKGTFFRLTPSRGRYAFEAFSFDGKPDEGGTPTGTLLALGGALYGTSSSTACACGVIYEVRRRASGYTASAYASLSRDQGSSPQGPLAADRSGDLFGTSAGGGVPSKACFNGCGTVFEVAADREVSVLHTFGGGADGTDPSGGLWQDGHGDFFGSTQYGGTGCSVVGCGLIFELTPGSGGYSERVIYSFGRDADGSSPSALAGDASGNLYGVTFDGGSAACACGTVFKLTQSRSGYVKSILHAFQGGDDGSEPNGPLQLRGGYLYGTTVAGGGLGCDSAGCGTVFRVRI